MSNCIKDLYDYDLDKKCCRCKNILLKSNFHINKNRKDGLHSQCKMTIIKIIITKIVIQNLIVVKSINFNIVQR